MSNDVEVEKLLLSICEKYIIFMGDFILIFIPISFTVYLFAYKEQREIAYSSIKSNNRAPFIGFLISAIILFVLMVLEWPLEGGFSKAYIAGFLTASLPLLFFTVLSYRLLLLKINPLKEFKRNIEIINKSISELEDLRLTNNRYMYAKKVQKLLRDIYISSEICFQILLTKEKNKMSNDFSASIQELNQDFLNWMIQINKDEHKFTDIVPYSGEQYFKLYQLVLKNLNMLIEVTVENKRDEELSLLLDSIIDIRPFAFNKVDVLYREWVIFKNIHTRAKHNHDLIRHYKDFYDEYFIYMHQIMSLLALSNENSSIQMNSLDKLVAQEFDNRKYFSMNDFLTLVTALFTKSIEKNNLKNLTDITNTYLKYLNRFESDPIYELKNPKIKVKAIMRKAKNIEEV